MNREGLESRFRNLLVALARDAEDLKQSIAELERASIRAGEHAGKRNGINLQITEREKQRNRILYLLSRNAKASQHFFGTVNTQEISCEQILFAEEV